MQVRLISITKPLINGLESAEDIIIHNARVSNPNNQLNVETGDKLLNFCIKHRHWSIFEQSDLTFEVKTSRAIAAQLLRHNSLRFQEYSQRYSEATEFEDIEFRLQGATNRQVGDEVVDLSPELRNLVEKSQEASKIAYKALVEAGIAKECARFVLPLNTQTTLCVKGSVRSFIHYFAVRCEHHTQKEHRLMADSMKEIFKKQFPITSKALNY